ncbi:hypothetical protein OHB44_27895 [Micromonospora sp. NBC_00821]|uniref:hypothetical protein n=1 Tax=Micromonospora sp. NBC_00821 TaxID=2975977 RepID=UPI002ED68D10|nr:hypothetical protein OHB44_27895 [Micromonospora sp. NBC_00821]
MTRRDPGAANGRVSVEPGQCVCGALEPLHTIVKPGQRGGCPSTGCRRYEPSNVIPFPGVGHMQAPAGPPARRLDLDAVADRWTDLLDARHRQDATAVQLLEAALAEDVPLLREEIHRLTVALRTAGHG